MGAPYEELLSLLDELSGDLQQLAELARQKALAVRKDDLLALDEVLKQEQAKTLSLRGIEQRRTKLLAETELEQVRLSDLPEHCPPELRLRTKQTVEQLQRSYSVYRSAADVARDTLECNIHELDKLISDLGGSPAPSTGSNYAPSESAPPPKMKTDFRA